MWTTRSSSSWNSSCSKAVANWSEGPAGLAHNWRNKERTDEVDRIAWRLVNTLPFKWAEQGEGQDDECEGGADELLLGVRAARDCRQQPNITISFAQQQG